MPPDYKTPSVYIEEIPSGVRRINGAPAGIAAFIGTARRGPLHEPAEIDSLAGFERQFGRGTALHTAVHLFFANGGRRAVVIRARGAGLRPHLQALRALEKAETFNLLCLPEAGGDGHVLAAAAATCNQRRAFLLIDPPAAWASASGAVSGLAALGLSSPNAALYFPRLKGRGGGGIPPGGAVAGVIARTDEQRGVWKSPAGMEAALHGITGLETALNDPDLDALNAASINGLKALPSGELVIWGARTLAGNDNEWRYIAVRRTALYIEESIYRGTKWVVFEPNDEPLWVRLRASIGDFLMGLFRAGAFAGAADDEAFFVKCDAETTLPADIAAKQVNVLVGFAPLKPAEFVLLSFTLQTS